MRRLSPRKQRQAGWFDLFVRPLWALAGPFIATRAGNTKIDSILVVELWRLGDVALLTPALGALRRRYPSARIALLAPAVAGELLQETGLIDEVIPVVMPWTAEEGKYAPGRYDLGALRRLFRELRARDFDVALSARMDLRDNVVMALSGARRRIGFAYGGGAFLLTDAVPAPDGHRVDDWLRLVTHAGATSETSALSLSLAPAERNWGRRWLAGYGVRDGDVLVGIHPGASAAVRRWPVERFAVVAHRAASRGARVVVFEAERDDAARWPEGTVIVPTGGLREFMSLLARCAVLVCNDSGPMHIGAALGVTTISIFTSQRPDWYAPQGVGHQHAVVPGFVCRPCFDACVFAEPYCNTSLGLERVVPLIDTALDGIFRRDGPRVA